MSLEGVLTLSPVEDLRGYVGRTDAQIKQDLEILREWMKKQAHLPQSASDHLLEMMLIHNKFSLEKVKKKMEMYYTVRTLFPDIFEDRAPSSSHMQALMNYYVVVPMPLLMPDHSRIILIHHLPGEPGVFVARDCLKYIFTCCDIHINFDRFFNDYCLVDMKYATIDHVRACTPTNARNSFFLLEQAFSARLKGIHFFNCSSLTLAIITVLKSVVKKKMADRMHIHKDVETLHTFFPKDCLPSDYGGNLGSVEEINNKWKKFLLNKEEWIVETGNLKTNEKVRVGELVSLDSLGLHGSFRQLQID